MPDGEFDKDGNLHPERYRLSENERREAEDLFFESQEAFEKFMETNPKVLPDDIADAYIAGGMEEARARRMAELDAKESELSVKPKMLDDYLKNDELFAAYPKLKDVKVVIGDAKAMLAGKQGAFDPKTKTLTLYDNSKDVFIHEVQHAIQQIEGFAMGGNVNTYRQHLEALKPKFDAWRVRNELAEKREELGGDVSDMDVYNALIKEYSDAGLSFGDKLMPSRETFDKGFNLWVRGYDNEGYEDAYNEYSSLVDKFGLGVDNNRYRNLAGEVEARNVSRRMSMTDEMRRVSLAEDTEDVSREEQIVLNGEYGVRFSLTDVNEAKRRATEIEKLNAINIKRNNKSKEDLYKIYQNLDDANVDGKNIKFFNSAFKKIYKDGGLFAQIIPDLKNILENSVLAYSEPDNLGGMVRKDGTEHKYHPNISAHHNYVSKVSIEGKEYYVRTTVTEQKGSTGTHSFMVSDVSLYGNSATSLSLPITTRARGTDNGIVDAKLQEFFDYANGMQIKNDSDLSENSSVKFSLPPTRVEFMTANRYAGTTELTLSDEREILGLHLLWQSIKRVFDSFS